MKAGGITVNNAGVTVTGGANDTVLLSRNGLNNGNNKITNVASGTNATDAATFGQLSTTNTNVATNAGNIATNTGDITNLQVQAGQGFNISAAGGANDNVQLGETVNFTNTDNNLVVTNTDNTINYNLAKDIDLGATGSVTAGGLTVNNSGVTVTGGTNDTVILSRNGLNNGNNKITNVDDGTDASDAATFGQVTAVDDKVDTLGSNTATNLGGGATYNAADGSVSAPAYTLNNGNNDAGTTSYNNVGAALGNLDTRTRTNTGDIANIQQQANLGFNIGADNGADDNVQLGETVNFTNTDTNLVATVSDNGINYDLADTITVDSVTAGDSLLNNDGLTVSNGPNGPVSLTNTGLDNGGNTITNIAAGSLADGSTDAINGSQLNTAADSIATTLGGDSIFDPATGTVTSPNYVLDDGTNTGTSAAPFTNVGAALGNLDTRTTTNTGDIADIQQQANLGFNIGADNGADDNVQLGETVNFTNTDTNLVATVSDNGINYDLADTITVDSVTAGDSLLNNDGLTVSNGPNGPVSLTNTGLDNGGNTITNIAAGSLADGSTDAINGSQLNTAADSIATTLGGDSIFDPATGTVTSPNYVLDDGTNTGTSAAPFTNVGAALGNLDTRTTTNTGDIADIQQQANLGFNIGADNGADDNVQLGETVNFTNTDTNLVATVSDNGINYDLADTITVDSVTAGDSLLNNDGLTVSNGPNGPVSLTNTGLDNGGNTITNIAAGSLADGSTDAINGSQLNTAADSIATTLGGDSIFDPATGTVTSPNYVLDDGTNTGTSAAPFTNVGAALGNLDTRTTTNTGDIADIQQQANLGFNIGADNGADDNVQLGETVNFTNTDTNLVATVSDNGINYDLADTITVDSVTAGDSLLNNDGLTVSNGPNGPVSLTNTGLDNGGNTITNIAAGSLADGSTDAINGSQLNTAADSIATTLGGDSIFDPATGTVTSPNYVLDDGTNTGTSAAPFTNVGAALGNLDTRTTTNTGDIADIQQQANLGFNIGADNGADDNVQLGETVNFTNTDTNLVATVSDNGINYDLADTITVDSVTAGDSLLNNDGLTVSNGPNGPVSLTNTGLDNGGNTITNIAAGSLADGSTDAINGSQLNTAADSIATTLGGDSIFDPATGTVTSPNYVLDDGTNTGTSAAPFTNVGAALGNLDTRTTTNTGDIADIQQQANL
ncbi:beta strand repeat-containing protein, partial [Psychrobacter sp. P11G3]|uniref:beta strand repeat-containing protein n=1 Tax=Psychrobacter sp. P11G3 TaxID=1699623 RepID=UPI0039B6EF5C